MLRGASEVNVERDFDTYEQERNLLMQLALSSLVILDVALHPKQDKTIHPRIHRGRIVAQ